MSVRDHLRRDTVLPGLVFVGLLLTAALVGRAAALGNSFIALLPALVIGGLTLTGGLSLSGWCTLLVVTSVISRAIVVLLGLPEVFNFLHYPATLAFLMVSSARPRHGRAKTPAGRWLMGFLFLTFISAAANLTNPLRVLMFVIITGEPLAILWGIQRWGPDEKSERSIGRAMFWLLALQLPIVLWQGFEGKWKIPDMVKGTMLNHGAGHHILGGLFALGLFAWLAGSFAGRHAMWTAPFIAIIAFAVMGAAGALQVILLGGLALPILLLSRRLPGGDRKSRSRRGGTIVVSMIVILLAASAPYWADIIVPGILTRAEELANPEQLTEVTFAEQRAHSDPLEFLLGSGPGTSGSRAALLLTPAYAKENSVFLRLPLKPTRDALLISGETKNPLYGGSAESAPSSMLAVVGDLGIVGVVGLALLLIGIVKRSRQVGSWLAPAITAAVVMSVGLSFIDNWLEYPEYTIPLAILIGLGTSRYPRAPKSRKIPRSSGRPLSLAVQ
jgi:hypothetical protein